MYDDLPKAMRRYLMHNGWHFNKSLCDFAVSLMKKLGKKLEPISKENVDKLLEQYKIQLDNNVGYLLQICVKLITTEVVLQMIDM